MEENVPIDFNQLRLIPDICSYCQRYFTTKNPRTLDHIIPCSKTGISRYNRNSQVISNLLICCYQCNQAKGNLSLISWFKSLNRYKLRGNRKRRIKLRNNIRNSIKILLNN